MVELRARFDRIQPILERGEVTGIDAIIKGFETQGFKIDPDGKGAPFYQTKATHAMTLAFDRDGRLLAGTESPGRVFRIDARAEP